MYILVIKYCYYFAFSDVQMKGFFKLVGVEQLTSKSKNIVFYARMELPTVSLPRKVIIQ